MGRSRKKDIFSPGRLLGWESTQDKKTLLLRYEAACAEISIDTFGTVRVRASAGQKIGPDISAALVRDPYESVRLEVTEHESSITVEPKKGSTKRRNPWARPALSIDRTRPVIEAFVAGSQPPAESGGYRPRLWAIELMNFSSTGAATAAVVTGIGTRYWGFGEKTGPLDKCGLSYTMRARDMPVRSGLDPLYAAIPFFMWSRPAWKASGTSAASSKKALDTSPAYLTSGCLLECFAPSHFDIARSFKDRVVISTEGWGIDLTLFSGPTPKDVLERYCTRTGLAPMPPLWALGYHQSRWSYETEQKIFEVAQEFAKRDIPLDVIHLDIDYMDGYRVFTWDSRRFPDPAAMIERLAESGIRVVTIVDPGVKAERGFDIFDEGMKRGVFCLRDDGELFRMWVWPRQAAFCDFNMEEARSFWGNLCDRLLDIGVSGIWNDMNEPAGWRLDLRFSKLILPLLPQDTSRMRQADPLEPSDRDVEHEKVRNIYAYQQCRALAEHLDRTRPQERHFMLTRSGYAGIQRFSAMWTGDIASSWRHLALSVRMLLGLSLSGVGFCGADIGGFVGHPSRELFARWIQLGALYPLSRTHTQGIWGWQEPYSFGARVESISRQYIGMRMRLLAYIYGLFAEYSRRGVPPWRPLFVEYPDLDEAYSIEDEIMLGPDVLIAPVMTKGSRTRNVFFPPGEWIPIGPDLSPVGKDRYTGPKRSVLDAPLEWMPVFVRAGVALPSLWRARTTAEITGELPRPASDAERPLVLKVFCHSPWYLASDQVGGIAKGSSTYYEDDFRSNSYKDGQFARYGIELEERLESEGEIVVRISADRREGAYDPKLEPTNLEVFCPPGFAPASAVLDGSEVDWQWNEGKGVMSVRRRGPLDAFVLEAVFSGRPAPADERFASRSEDESKKATRRRRRPKD
jgi:alpha-glucosidase